MGGETLGVERNQNFWHRPMEKYRRHDIKGKSTTLRPKSKQDKK